MKKTFLLVLLVLVALIIDGTLTYDIFDFRKETRGAWLMILLAVFLLLVILIADASKKHDDEDSPG